MKKIYYICVDLFIAIGAIYVGMNIYKTGWSYFYDQPVPKPVGLIFIVIGIGIILYKGMRIIKRKK